MKEERKICTNDKKGTYWRYLNEWRLKNLRTNKSLMEKLKRKGGGEENKHST